MLFDLFKACDYIESSHKSGIFTRKKTIFLHAYATYYELPSNISTIKSIHPMAGCSCLAAGLIPQDYATLMTMLNSLGNYLFHPSHIGVKFSLVMQGRPRGVALLGKKLYFICFESKLKVFFDN